ncbi:MAG: phosphatase PAP2 family protein [Anaerolineales bacterium]|nr:phosphatase PAP2 family protein [Anaerolineales bacterium]MCX7608541.1 phosphatase PAP2 family protein [Anaerolineales bacterium]
MSLARLLELDARLSARLRVAERPGILRNLSIVLAHSGDSWFWWSGLALLIWKGEPFWRTWALTVLISILALAVLVLTIKFTIRRRRPEGNWGKFYRMTDPHSFPSGHAARAALIAVLTLGSGPPWLALLFCLWAPLVALARVAMGVHYLSDIFIGALIGSLSALVVLEIISVF